MKYHNFRARAAWILTLSAAMVAVAGAQTLTSAATTTLTAETANNTSAPDSFATSINNNVQPGNVSKLPLRSLLPEGSPTKIYAHFVAWFGGRDHIDIGYHSSDPEQVTRQVDDMVSRGIDGMIIDWYGPPSSNTSASARNTEAATQHVMQEAERRGDFEFAIMVDKGALHRCREDCNPTKELIHQLTYVNDTYAKSPAYVHIDGRPVVLFFGVDSQYDIDWKKVTASVPGKPLLIFQDSRGFVHHDSKSSYGWVHIEKGHPRNWMGQYLHWLYDLGQRVPESHTIGAVFKGFDDAMASWSLNRVVSQDCGRTWLRTWEALAANQDVSKPLDAVQLVTWNDYEEGTELETGIDTCTHLQAWRKGSGLNWHLIWTDAKAADIKANGPSEDEPHDGASVAGAHFVDVTDSPEATLDHYTVFVSQDGQNLTPVGDFQPGNEHLDLSSLQLAPGHYTAYIKAVAKPGLLNQMSRAISFTIAPPPSTTSAAATSAPATVVSASAPIAPPPGISVATTPPPSATPTSTDVSTIAPATTPTPTDPAAISATDTAAAGANADVTEGNSAAIATDDNTNNDQHDSTNDRNQEHQKRR